MALPINKFRGLQELVDFIANEGWSFELRYTEADGCMEMRAFCQGETDLYIKRGSPDYFLEQFKARLIAGF